MNVAREKAVRRRTTTSQVQSEDIATSSTDRAVGFITEGVLAGRYVPAQRLIEAELTRILGISRGPIREAFRRLSALGVVKQTLNRGACIRALSRREASDLLVAAEPLFSFTARLAARTMAESGKAEHVLRLAEELRRFGNGSDELYRSVDQRRHFYDILIGLSGNSELPSLVPTMRVHLLRVQVNSFADEEYRREHRVGYAKITAAVLAGDDREAARAMSAHSRHMKQMIDGLPEQAFPLTDGD